MTAADVLIECLLDWGVDVIFGLPGDGINGIMEALRKRQDKVRFVQVRHEESAAFMACGYAKVTGKLGVCLATSGPGGIHLFDARTSDGSRGRRPGPDHAVGFRASRQYGVAHLQVMRQMSSTMRSR